MQELKAKGHSSFSIDKAFLAQHSPSLILTQDSCQACDVSSSAVAQVCLAYSGSSLLWDIGSLALNSHMALSLLSARPHCMFVHMLY